MKNQQSKKIKPIVRWAIIVEERNDVFCGFKELAIYNTKREAEIRKENNIFMKCRIAKVHITEI